ncbi:MAG: 30S ribosomal protein S3 [Verrucomicrobia bacterium]|nr:30S ribosomal protein S3 [Verrucomicrobiota bacterium]
MGQKVCPIGFRISRNKKWRSIWFANKQEFATLLLEDAKIRRYLEKKACCQGTSKITIKRMAEKVEVTIHTARPGLAIGKKGGEIEQLKKELRQLTGKEVWIEIEEVKRPDL